MSITDELREYANRFKNSHDAWSGIGDDLTAIADRIDAEHQKALEQERNRGFTDGYDMGFANADDWFAQHEDAMAEHGWVRRNKEHVISHATVDVTPHIDWSRMADELDVFTQLVRGFAGQVEEDA